MTLVFIGAVVALAWLGFRDAPWVRRMFGLGRFTRHGSVFTGATSADEVLAGIVARAGSRAEPTVTIDRSIHPATWGVKLVTPALSLLALGAWPALVAADPTFDAHGGIGVRALVALLVYTNLYVWAFRLEIDRDTLSVMGPAFLMRDYPLAGLERIEEHGPLAWRMRFADGRRPQVLKTVVGAAGLRQRLAEVLAANERG